MFNLVICIELIVDIGNHILTEVFQKSAKTYRETIIYLGDLNVISKEFSKENQEMTGFRNRLIHDYGRVELEEVYENLQKAPNIFRKFAKYYINFLENRK